MITKEDLKSIKFYGDNGLYTYDFDRIYFDIKTQSLLDIDESGFDDDFVVGNFTHKTLEELIDMIYIYFKVDVTNNFDEPDIEIFSENDIMNAIHKIELEDNKNYSILFQRIKKHLKTKFIR
ncbi:hypothetical protein M0Q97_02590 [Candidatus Dojkabacteria bacterium]|jgi:hypothetical protein|nr:hypothetical protein [Candidatus Dojkabacteria bacterium]